MAFAISFAAQSAEIDRKTQVLCENLADNIKVTLPGEEEQLKLKELKRALELEIATLVDERRNVARDTQIHDAQVYERAMILLTRGDVRELIPLLTPYFRAVYDNYEILEETYTQLRKAKERKKLDRAEIAALEKKIQAASIPFGQNYGPFTALYNLLTTVAAGEGAGKRNEIALQRSNEKQRILLNLLSPLAVASAKRALGILNPRTENLWTPALDDDGDPIDLIEIKTMFVGNIHALLAKLQRDADEQKRARKIWKRALYHLANFYLNLSDQDFIPERYRQSILRILGIAYDQLMLERHLGKIQALVDISRNRSPDGEIVLSSDVETMELQLKSLLDFDATAVGNDLLITFARVGYHTEVWINLKAYVNKKVEETSKTSTLYADLAQRMNEAEARAKELSTLPYMYKPAISHQLIFAGSQLAYLVLTEESLRRGLIPWLQSFF